MSRNTRLMLLALSVLNLTSLLVAAASLDTNEQSPTTTSNCDNEQEKNPPTTRTIKPFEDEMLPRSQLQGDLVPGLGRLMLLDTYFKPKAAEAMETSFSIHRKGESVVGIKFRAVQQTNSTTTTTNQLNYHYDLDQMAASGFDVTKKTVVMISGYRSPLVDSWIGAAKNGWLELYGDDVNVITVCWHDSSHGVYSQAVAHTILVARQLTIFLYYLYELSGAKIDDQQVLDKMHLIGHSLGAHIAGFVGQDLGGRVGRITGLDPAGPSFDQYEPSQRLDRADAKLVEVLHTNSGQMSYFKLMTKIPSLAAENLWPFYNNQPVSPVDERDYIPVTSGLATSLRHLNIGREAWFGIKHQVGHVEYYANDGSEQPGCTSQTHVCDHKRAHEIYVDILRYEIILKEAQGGEQDKLVNKNRHRLLAFKAPGYESFETGENFANCSTFLPAQILDNKQSEDEANTKCFLPLLDFVTPLDELIQELRSEYGINFESQAPDQPQPRYYFKTSSGELLGGSKNNFIGDHHMLRIYLANEEAGNGEETFRWIEPKVGATNWCSLRIHLIMSDGKTASMELGHLRPIQAEIKTTDTGTNSEVSGKQQRFLAIPFVHPTGSRARLDLDYALSLLETSKQASEQQLENEQQAEEGVEQIRSVPNSAEFSEVFRQIMPKTVVLTVDENKPILSNPANCRLNVAALEIHPITIEHRRHSIGALYGNRLALDQQIPLTTGKQLVERLQSHPDRLGSTIRLASSCGNGVTKSFGAGLESAIIDELAY